MASTIKDIARKLNISVSTVSYALNDGPRSVPAEVKKKVLETAKELDYRPNRLARSLVTRRTHTVGVVPGFLYHDLVLSPFVQAVLNGILNALEDEHHDGLIFTGMNMRSSDVQVDRLLDGRIDGVIFLPPAPSEDVLWLLDQRRFPYVTIASEDHKDRVNLSADNAMGVRLAIDHLVALGHKKIGMIEGLDMHRDAMQRRQSFDQAMASHGLPVRPEWTVTGGFTSNGGAEAAHSILKRPSRPTALFCANDESAFGALLAARMLGLDVPRDLSVVGYDDIVIAQQSTPPLTTIRQSVEDMGRAAVDGLLQLLFGKSVSSQMFEPKLVKRSSTSCPPEDIQS